MAIIRISNLIRIIAITVIILSLVIIIYRKTEYTANKKTFIQLPEKNKVYRVIQVIDGDTIILENGETVRLIGIDAPELHHPELPVQRFATESKNFLKNLIEGHYCSLEYENGKFRDRYGRILAYVFKSDLLVNAEMIRKGYAYAYTLYPFKREYEFLALEREARLKQAGMWNFSLKDSRIANLVTRYNSLNSEGRRKLDEILDILIKLYPITNDIINQNN